MCLSGAMEALPPTTEEARRFFAEAVSKAVGLLAVTIGINGSMVREIVLGEDSYYGLRLRLRPGESIDIPTPAGTVRIVVKPLSDRLTYEQKEIA